MKYRSRSLAVAVGAVSLAASLVACGSAQSAGVNEDGQTQLIVGSMPSNSLAFPYTVAREQGFFADEGIVTETVDAKTGPELTATLIGGSTQIAVGTPENVMSAMNQGQDLVAIAPFGKIDMQLVVPAQSGITDFKQLEGKQLGVVQRGSFAEKFARAVLAENGVDPESVTYVAVGSGATMEPALRAGKIDAVVATGSSVVLVRSHGLDVKTMVNTMDGTNTKLGDYALQTFWGVTGAFKKANPETVLGFCRAMNKAAAWIRDDANRATGAASLGKLLDVTPEAAEQIWDSTNQSWSPGVTAEQWGKNVEWILGEGSTSLPYAERVDASCQ